MLFKKLTLDCVLKNISEKYSTRKAIIFEDVCINYNELYLISENIAQNLRDLGIRKNDKVAIILPNCLEYIYTYFALFIIGAWAVPLSTRYEPDELKNIIKDSDASTVIYKDRIGTFNYNQILFSLKKEFPLLKRYICLSENNLPEVIRFEELLIKKPNNTDNKKDIKFTLNSPDDIALLAYTSGTTGKPKGVMVPHKNLVLTSYYTAKLWDVKNDVAFSIAPLFAAQGFLAVLIDLVAGVTMKWISQFNPNHILSHLIKEEVTAFHTQPTMWTILLSLTEFKYINFKNLKKVVVSGSLCSYNLAKRIQDSIGCNLLNAYGLVEATGVVTITRPDDTEDVKLNTVGSPIPGVEIKIVDKNRKKVRDGEIGELAVRGYIMKGYYKNEEKTRSVIDEEGWLYSGDLASYHSDGKNIKIVGRLKDMVIRGGFNVYPIDIEECLLTSEKIEDVAVVGRQDDILGESLVAFVIPKPDAQISICDVKSYCRGKIANYKIPDEVYFVSQFPILLSGKICKNVLEEWATNVIPAEYRLLFNNIPVGKL